MTTSLGERLRKIRESREISLEEISQKTHIRLEYLDALENDATDQLPRGPLRRGFLRLYASELGLDLEAAELDEIQTESEVTEKSSSEEDPQSVSVDAKPVERPETETTPPRELEKIRPEPQKLPEREYAQQTAAGSGQTFHNLGQALCQRRELLSLSIDDIFEHIHIRKKFLNAMEAGDFTQLPSPVQARGMLANYADFLDLDVDEILLQYADGLQLQRLERTRVNPQAAVDDVRPLSRNRLRLKNFFSLDLLVIAALILGFAAFVIWGVSRILRENEPAVSATDIPEVADILLATGSPTPLGSVDLNEQGSAVDQTGTPTPEEATPIFTPLPNDSPINIVIIPRQRAWVRVTSDSEMVFEGRMIPGNAYDYSGEDSLEILTGSAGALQIYYNDQDIGAPGLVGQVANLIFTVDGLILPTPTNTPTITETPQETLTPTPSPTPSQTLQPTATSTEPND